MSYVKTNWQNDQAPAIDATNLNKIETGIAESRNVALLAVDSTAPAHCSEGDLYYNTTTKKIYEAIDTDVWDSTGVDPIGDILYIIFSTKTTYSYDGTDLVSVGGGGAEVSVSTTQPTEDEILWINPDDVPSGSLNPITNEYSIATDKGYSCNYLNNVNTYSTDEVNTGKTWIDGKPIYRKVISGEKTGGDILATGVDTLVSANGTIAVSSYPRLIPYFEMYMNAVYIGTIGLDNNSVKVSITEAGQTATRDCEITLEYTKTTD